MGLPGWDVSQPFGWKSLPYGRAAFNFCSPETAHMRSTDPKILFSCVDHPISCPQTERQEPYLFDATMAFPVFPQPQGRIPTTSPFSKVGNRREREGKNKKQISVRYFISPYHAPHSSRSLARNSFRLLLVAAGMLGDFPNSLPRAAG